MKAISKSSCFFNFTCLDLLIVSSNGHSYVFLCYQVLYSIFIHISNFSLFVHIRHQSLNLKKKSHVNFSKQEVALSHGMKYTKPIIFPIERGEQKRNRKRKVNNQILPKNVTISDFPVNKQDKLVESTCREKRPHLKKLISKPNNYILRRQYKTLLIL